MGVQLMFNSFSSQSDSEPTLPHMPAVPPDEDYAARTRPGSLPAVPPDPYARSVPAPAPVTWEHGYPAAPSAPPYERAVRERDRRRRVRQRRSGGDWAWVVIALTLFGVTLVISLSVYVILRSNREAPVAAEDGMTSAVATAVVVMPTAVPNLELYGGGGGGPGGEPQANSEGVIIEPWDGQERFTILVMGWDRRASEEANGAYRTDTMLLVSLDPATDTVGVLSIPRDLYVNIPGYSQLQRVNSAYVLGELQRPGYGPQLAMQTVQYNLGMRVHDYLIVDFNAFITLVDAIGGIEVDVPTTINDPQYPDLNYGYDPFYLPAGHHHLNGYDALRYARTRHGSNDFRRAERQQQVLFAIRDRIMSLDALPQLIVNAPSLWAGLQNNIHTGLELDQILRLAWYAKDIPLENIRTGVINEYYTSFYTAPDGASVLIPNRYSIGSLMVEVFGPGYNQ